MPRLQKDDNHHLPPPQLRSDTLYRQGNLLVFQKYAPLPNICLKSNQPATGQLKRSLSWHPPGAWFALLLGVSGVTVLNWERSPRPLRPLIRVRQVWPDVVALTPEEASICLETLSE